MKVSVLEKIEGAQQPSHYASTGLAVVWRALRRHAALVFVVTALSVAAAYVVLQRLEPSYQAQSTVVMSQLDTRIRTTDVELESFELSRVAIETEMDVLRSREFAADVADALSLFDDAEFVPPPDQPGTEPPELRRERVIDKVLESYTVFREGDSLAIKIRAVSEIPSRAADIANTVAKTYIRKTNTERREGISRSIEFLRTKVEQLGEELSQSEIDLAIFIRENNLDDEDLPDQQRAELERLNSIRDAIRQDPNAEDKLREIEEQVNATQAALLARTKSELILLRMERALELLRARYQTSMEKLNELETQLHLVSAGARQVTVARVPEKPYWPNRPVVLATGALAGLVVSFLAAAFLETLDTRIWSESQIERNIGTLNYGFLPRIKKRGLISRVHAPLWYLANNPRSAFAEAVRNFLTLWFNLFASGKVLMVTSGLPNEGKSTVAVSIAAAAAKEGMKVLVLDMDSYHLGASKELGSEREAFSLDEVIAGQAEPEEIELEGGSKGSLHLMALKLQSTLASPDEKENLDTLKSRVKAEYDFVLIDTPPVLVVNDTCRFGPLADKTLFVVRWGHSKLEATTDAINKLETHGVEVAATLINDVDISKQKRYGYGGYAHHYRYYGEAKSG